MINSKVIIILIFSISLTVSFGIFCLSPASGLTTMRNSSLSNSSSFDPSLDTTSIKLNYSYAMTSREPAARWNMTIWVEPPEMLSQISKVEYYPYPFFINLPYSGAGNNFNRTLYELRGAIGVNATIYLTNGDILTRYLVTRISGPSDVYPITLNLDPKVSDLHVSVRGNAVAKEGQVTKVVAEWGDGSNSTQQKLPFSFNHTYANPGSYTIRITAFNDQGVHVFQTLSTPDLILQQSIPKDIPFAFDPRTNRTLSLWTSAKSIPDNMPLSYTISGVLSSTQLNQTDVSNKRIKIMLYGIDYPDIYNNTVLEPAITEVNGSYSSTQESFELPSGRYRITVAAEDPNVFGLNVTEDLFVAPHPLSLDELTGYLFGFIGVALAIIGGVTKIPSYFSERKKAEIVSYHLKEICKKCEAHKLSSTINKTDRINELEAYRLNIVNLLGDSKIREGQYKILDEKISDCIKLLGDKK